MPGRVLFKQPNIVSRFVGGRKGVKPRLNFRSNVAGIIKLVYAVNLREVHLAYLRRTSFWIMIDAILMNQIDHTEFRKGDDLIVRILRSYSVREGKFVLGGRAVDLTDEDMKLLFGLQGGNAFLDLTPRPRPASDFVQRRCPGTSRITAKLVKDLLMEASVGDTPNDHEDTAKFICLDFHRTPEKVTGCVVALTFWLCEHTNIVKPKYGHRFPRFLRWDVGELLSTSQGLKLSETNKFEVITDELSVQVHEVAMLEGERMLGEGNGGLVEEEGGKVTGLAVSGTSEVAVTFEGRSYGKQCSGSIHKEDVTVPVGMRSVERGGVSSVVVEGGDGKSNCGHVGSRSPDFITVDAGDSKVVMELKNEVERLKRKNEMQSVNLVGGFESIFKVKDEECKKLIAENAELRRSLAALEEQVAEQAVHSVTQHFTSVNVTDPNVDGYVVRNGVGVGNVQDHCTTVEGGIMVDASPVAYVPIVDNNEMHDPILADDSDVVVVSPLLTEGGNAVGGMNSFVRNIKCKVRKNLKLSGFEYPELRRKGRVMNNEVNVSKTGVVGCSVDVVKSQSVIDVDGVGDGKKIFTSFGITNRNTVWKMMTETEKDVISNAYDRYGDRVVMWVGRIDGNAVYFSDVRSLVRQLGVRGNVIDAFAEVLSDEQERLNVGKDFPENSYFFSSICWDVMKGDNVEAKFKYVTSNLRAGRDARYIHFPVCHLGHWTLVVYDTEDGSWKHYNSMRSRTGTGGVHYAEAVKLKKIVTDIQRQAMAANGLEQLVGMQDFDMMVESVSECPQQRAETMDCAIIVCAVMRQYVNHVDVGRSLEGGNCSVLRADMVKRFIRDPIRGVMSNMGRMVG
ncbi:hypothetical protein CsSME_00015653 [Camellia sinensis var. sinensis]